MFLIWQNNILILGNDVIIITFGRNWRNIVDKFNAKHLGFVLVGVAVVSLKSYPTILTRNGGRDTWIAMMAAGLLILLYLFFALQVFKKSDFASLSGIYRTAIGKGLGYFFIFFFGLSLFLTLIESASVEANSMHTNMLLSTPSWQIMLLFIPPALYTVKRGIGAIMAITVISMVLVSISGINLSLLTYPYKHWYHLKPFLENGLSQGLFLAFLQELGLLGCFAIMFPFISYLGDSTKFVKYIMIAMIFVVQMEIVALNGIIMTFDIKFLNTMSYPKLLQTQLISEFKFLESGELFVMLQMVGGWFVKYVLTFFALIRLIEVHVKIKYLAFWISGICYGISFYVSNDLIRLFKYLDFYTYLCLVNFVIIPFIIFMIYALRKYPTVQAIKTKAKA